MKNFRVWSSILGLSALALGAPAQTVKASGNRVTIDDPHGRIEAWAVAPNVLRIDFRPSGVQAEPTPVLDPKGLRTARPVGKVDFLLFHLQDPRVDPISLDRQAVLGQSRTKKAEPTSALSFDTLEITPNKGVGLEVDLDALKNGVLTIHHAPTEHLYGMRGYGLRKSKDPRLDGAQGLFRDHGAPVAAGSQGDGGAPIAFTTHWGLLVDSVDGDFTTNGDALSFSHGSRKDLEAYIVLGPPETFMRAVADLTGHPPMPPKWSLGFLNSQWGDDESVVRAQVAEYRQKQIPLDAFILDFDYKAWGEDNYGEFRWNSTSGPGNVGPDKF